MTPRRHFHLNVAGPIGAGTPTTEDGVTYVDVDKNAAA